MFVFIELFINIFINYMKIEKVKEDESEKIAVQAPPAKDQKKSLLSCVSTCVGEPLMYSD